LDLVGESEAQIVVREPADVMLVRVADELADIQRAWPPLKRPSGCADESFYELSTR
jgi:hypothetical protein